MACLKTEIGESGESLGYLPTDSKDREITPFL